VEREGGRTVHGVVLHFFIADADRPRCVNAVAIKERKREREGS